MKNIFIATTVVFSQLFILNSCKNSEKQAAQTNNAIDTSNFNYTAKPTEDFYEYVNGGWMKKNPIPATEASWGSFNEIYENNIKNLKTILEEAMQSNAPAGSAKQKIGDFYYSAMDTVKIEADGIAGLQEEFAKIDAIKKIEDFPKVVAQQYLIGPNHLFNLWVGVDAKNSSQYSVHLGQGGIGLPDRDYYFSEDARSKEIQKEYTAHLKNMLQFCTYNEKEAEKNAIKIMAIETDLASKSRTMVQRRDQEAQYNKKTLADLQQLTPQFNWSDYFTALNIPEQSYYVVDAPEFFEQMNLIIGKYSIEDWKGYFKWNLLHSMAPKLNKAIYKENFHFYATVLAGVKEQKPRWKTSLDATDNAVGELLGQLYVEKHFPPAAKQRVTEMIDHMISVYKERIQSRTWMSEETKKQAISKLDKVIKKIGYPDTWKDYSSLTITRDSYIQNFINCNKFISGFYISKLGKPVDKTEWGMTPPTVNAYYNPSLNEIVFPAGIMQPPFFYMDADDAVNYGGMGAIIGHELTHGFDDQGAEFDADGNMKNWWAEADKKNFKTKTQMVVNQFNNYKVLDTLKVNGELTLGENIADLGGLTISYYALKKSMEGKPAPEKIAGFTPEQRFFISWAQGWRQNTRPESLRMQVLTNPHSPNKLRCNGPFTNMKEFYEAFGVKEGDKLYLDDTQRAEIW